MVCAIYSIVKNTFKMLFNYRYKSELQPPSPEILVNLKLLSSLLNNIRYIGIEC